MSQADLLKELRIDRSQREAHRSGPPSWLWWLLSALVMLALVAVGAWFALSQRSVDVQTAQAVSPASNPGAGAVLQATGYITARRQATVSAQITGTLTEVLIEEGDHVKKGQILARLDDSAYKASLMATQAQAAASHALVSQLQAQAAQSERDASRLEALVARGLVSRQDAEQARTQVDSQRAQLASQQRQAKAADAQVSVAEVNFDYTVVRAPFDGVITTKDAQVGEIISPLSAGGGFTRTGVGTIVDMGSLEVDVDVNEAYIGRVKAGMPAEAILDAYPDWKIPAHVIAIVPAADRGKATVKVRVAFEGRDDRIVPDMGVRVNFLEQATKTTVVPQGVLVPATAIVQRDGRSVVFVLSGDRVHRREVNPAAQAYGDMRLVPASLQSGDTIVISPPDDLQDGARATDAKTRH